MQLVLWLILIPNTAATPEHILFHFNNRLQWTVRIVLVDAGVTIVVLTDKNVLG